MSPPDGSATTPSAGRPTLVQAAAARLTAGPAHTLELANQVLRLRGNEGAAASAVFALLGADPRFVVDGEGVWSLRGSREPTAGALSTLRCAVVDVETTGGGPSRGDRVIEVAIVHLDGGIIGAQYQSLVNPGRAIPRWIRGLTGISDAMVAPAPGFEGIAPIVREHLEGRVFVAHNASFDWGFLRNELLTTTGEHPEIEPLCTVRLGRLLVPGLGSHGLDALTRHFGIRIDDRHRALGDALATAHLLRHLLEEAEARGIEDLPALREALAPKRAAPRSRHRGSPDGS